MVGQSSIKTEQQLVETSRNEIHDHVLAKARLIEGRILHYFKCAGCKHCSAAVRNMHLSAHNEKEFRDEVQFLKRTVVKELNTSMDKFEKKLITHRCLRELSNLRNGSHAEK